MNHAEFNARQYCLSLGLDPNEIVWGYVLQAGYRSEKITSPRWTWYIRARIENG